MGCFEFIIDTCCRLFSIIHLSREYLRFADILITFANYLSMLMEKNIVFIVRFIFILLHAIRFFNEAIISILEVIKTNIDRTN